MNITDAAKETLEKFLSEKEASSIRLFTESGCCGPQIAISLEQPKEKDTIATINGIKVAFDPEVTGTDEITLDHDQNGLVLLGAGGCC
ncbi:Fe-S cluster assembly iron-binding protein IscA [Natronobacillus azotifigens]|uniref:Adhesin n=1 Tax=Natronobacillus azotifigens TaxID=472978 RepID=A0A9J6R8N7_9BACI|nr:adhesin [Natronobacillus azotifigens]MCZ0701927.1 adhesin [Natronobacillus azotifigens]